MEKPPETYNVRAVQRAMQILTAFDGEHADRDEELEAGIRAVSAPIRDIVGNVIAALSVAGPVTRMPPQRMREIVDALLGACSAISAHVLRA